MLIFFMNIISIILYLDFSVPEIRSPSLASRNIYTHVSTENNVHFVILIFLAPFKLIRLVT